MPVAPYRVFWHTVRVCVTLCIDQSFPERAEKAVQLEHRDGPC